MEKQTGAIAYDWDDPWTVHYYEAFNRQHGRYRRANDALIEQAEFSAGQRILDFAAGTGRTAETALPHLGPAGRILCVEPAGAMRQAGQKRLDDARVSWSAELPGEGQFHRVLCGAAIWGVANLEETIGRLARYLPAEGALCFNIPALYLGVGDEPGGGDDPLLLQLPAKLAEIAPSEPMEWDGDLEPLSVDKIGGYLEEAGLRPKRFSFRYRLTQTEFRDWYKIPVLTNRLLPELDAEQRAAVVDKAYAACDHESWRWERWIGWRAEKMGG